MLVAANCVGCSVGIGGGVSSLARHDGDPRDGDLSGAIVVDGKWTWFRNERLAFGLFGNFTLSDFETVGDTYHWLADHTHKDTYKSYTWPLLGLGYAFAWLLGTNIMTSGAVLTWRVLPGEASPYIDFGWGPTLILDLDDPNRGAAVGTAFAFGPGYEINRLFGIQTRVIWSPEVMHSGFTSASGDVFAVSVLFVIRPSAE